MYIFLVKATDIKIIYFLILVNNHYSELVSKSVKIGDSPQLLCIYVITENWGQSLIINISNELAMLRSQ
jgi:hypothetical protein